MRYCVVLLLFTLSGCLVRPVDTKITVGMTRAEVLERCGEPDKKTTSRGEYGASACWLYYFDVPYPKVGVCYVVFSGGKVVSITRSE